MAKEPKAERELIQEGIGGFAFDFRGSTAVFLMCCLSWVIGQTLIVISGCGWAQHAGGPIEEIPPGEKHWHGATMTTAMTHIAIQEALDGKVVDWMETVPDDQYKSKR